jgi:hypothetical protein
MFLKAIQNFRFYDQQGNQYDITRRDGQNNTNYGHSQWFVVKNNSYVLSKKQGFINNDSIDVNNSDCLFNDSEQAYYSIKAQDSNLILTT